jgi:ubiquinone biosynthesis protein
VLKQRLIPTPLLSRDARRRVEVRPVQPPSRLRLFQIFVFFGAMLWNSGIARLRRKPDPARVGRHTRLFLEKMGGAWVKVGQVLAMRRDLFSEAFCDELSLLQDRARGFPGEVAREIIEKDLGGPISEFFSEFDEQPIAAASIGQTHEGRLRHNGVRVAIKVQRPFIQEHFKRDLSYIRFVVLLLVRFQISPHGRWEEGLWELEKTLTEELDYRIEAMSITRMRRSLRDHKVYAPKVFSRLCTQRVLVMEFLEGVFMSEFIAVAEADPVLLQRWMAENNVSPQRVGERLYFTHIRQVVEDNLFHGDLHPGNILLLRESRIALIDFGSVGSFEEGSAKKYRLLFRSMGRGEYDKVADMFLLMGPPLPRAESVDKVKSLIVRALRTWATRTSIKSLPYNEKSLTSATLEIGRISMEHGIPATWEFMRLNRASTTLDASLMFLIPRVNYIKLMQRYQQKVWARRLKAGMDKRRLMAQMESMSSAMEAPGTLAENIYFESEMLRRKARSFQMEISKAGYFGKVIFSVISRGALLLTALALAAFLRKTWSGFQSSEETWFSRVMAALPDFRGELWLAVALFGLYVFQLFIQLRRRFEQKEGSSYDMAR